MSKPDYQKQEAKQCLWDQDGQHTDKRSRNKGKGRGKEKRDIRVELSDLELEAQLDIEDWLSGDLDDAWYCYVSGGCESCRARSERNGDK